MPDKTTAILLVKLLNGAESGNSIVMSPVEAILLVNRLRLLQSFPNPSSVITGIKTLRNALSNVAIRMSDAGNPAIKLTEARMEVGRLLMSIPEFGDE